MKKILYKIKEFIPVNLDTIKIGDRVRFINETAVKLNLSTEVWSKDMDLIISNIDGDNLCFYDQLYLKGELVWNASNSYKCFKIRKHEEDII